MIHCPMNLKRVFSDQNRIPNKQIYNFQFASDDPVLFKRNDRFLTARAAVAVLEMFFTKFTFTECCYHVFSNVTLNGQILKKPDHTYGTEKVYHQCVFSYDGSAHLTGRISSHSPSNYIYKAFHQCVSFGEPLNDLTWYSSYHIRGDHRYELAFFASIWPFLKVLSGDPVNWPLRPPGHS